MVINYNHANVKKYFFRYSHFLKFFTKKIKVHYTAV